MFQNKQSKLSTLSISEKLPELSSLLSVAKLEYEQGSSTWLRLGVNSLELRRLRHDLIYTEEVVFGLVTNARSDFSY